MIGNSYFCCHSLFGAVVVLSQSEFSDMKVFACALGFALAASAFAAASNATSPSAFENLLDGQMEATIANIVPGFNWQWLQRNPQVSRSVEDETLDWVFGDYYARTESEEQRCRFA